jgi:hypothetical protein
MTGPGHKRSVGNLPGSTMSEDPVENVPGDDSSTVGPGRTAL